MCAGLWNPSARVPGLWNPSVRVPVCGIQVSVCRVFGIQVCVCRSVESKCACAAGSVESKCANPKARELNCGTQERLCPSVWACASFRNPKERVLVQCAQKCAGRWNPFHSAHKGLWSSVSVRVRVCGAQYQCACGSVELSIISIYVGTPCAPPKVFSTSAGFLQEEKTC
jgi:hypothetical protein